MGRERLLLARVVQCSWLVNIGRRRAGNGTRQTGPAGDGRWRRCDAMGCTALAAALSALGGAGGQRGGGGPRTLALAGSARQAERSGSLIGAQQRARTRIRRHE